MKDRTKDVAWDEDFWVDGLMSGSLHTLNEREPESSLVILVPDGAGDYREHSPVKPKGRLGF